MTRPRQLAALLACALVLLASAAGTASAAPAPDAAGGPAPAARIRVNFQTPTVAADGDFSMLLRVRNAPAASDLVVRIYDRIETAAQLLASEGDTPRNLLATFDPINLTATGTALAEQPAGFTINLYSPGQPRPPTAWAYRLSEAGVYPIEVRLRGTDNEILTSIVTYLIRQPDGNDQVTPTPVSLLAAIHRPPSQVPAQRLATDRVDPVLLRRLGPVLDQFTAHPNVPTSFSVTADNALQLAGDPAARRLAAQLRAELGASSRELLGSPYVRIDPAALVSNGLADELTRQHDLGTATLRTTLVDPVANTWYLDKRLDAATVQALRRRGVTRLVLPASIVADDPVGPGILTDAGRDVVAATVPSGLNLGGAGGADPKLEGYQAIGRLSAQAAMADGVGGLTVRVTATGTDPATLAVVLDALGQPNRFIRPQLLSTQLNNVSASAPQLGLHTPPRVDLGAYATRSRLTHAQVSSFGSMVPEQPQRALVYQRPMALSASADLPLAQRNRDLDRVSSEVQRQFSLVTVPPRDTVTLGARDGTFPLIVTSGLGHPAQVVIELQASDRLDFPDDRIEATITGRRTVVKIRVHTRGSGDTPLLVTTRTPDGTVILGQTRYTVRSTAVSGVGVVLTVSAGLFLALWWGRHWLRHRRRAKHARTRFGPSKDPVADLDTSQVLIATPADDPHGTPDTPDVTDPPNPGSNRG